ncbi:cobalt-precorrin 5A hydrolase [Gudongella sp. SC589]|jgi:cobalt-precorrin 5A hydrolase|uniref:cobalt-precorrin 5A hydrolase n=1 Tax=Gudongella sp. SC589 TaxID=3385990 RepID=UPI003904B588
MKSAVISFSKEGHLGGEKLAKSAIEGFCFTHYPFSREDGSAPCLVRKLWHSYDALVFISAAGIATRLVAPLIASKVVDPAVVCMDDLGKYAIPLLSGHLGGANLLAKKIGILTGSTVVITTATDIRGIQAPDLFAKENNYLITNPESLTGITASMVNGKPVGFYSECEPEIGYEGRVDLSEKEVEKSSLPGMIIVSSKRRIRLPRVPYLLLRPRNINVGIGCRRGAGGDGIIQFIKDLFRENELSLDSIGNIGTVEIKREEPGILEAAEYFRCNLKVVSMEDIERVQDRFPKSQFVKESVGVYSVSQPVAYLLGGEMLVQKAIRDGITISISREA